MATATLSPLSDESLAERAAGGDRDAFEALYERYFERIYDFLARMMRDRDEAADVAQDTFLRAIDALPGLRDRTTFKSWLFTIARNLALNRIERSGRVQPLSAGDDDEHDRAFEIVDPARLSDPAQAAEASAAASLVWEAAAGLDERQRTVLELNVRQDLEPREIAVVLGVTANNAGVILNRARESLQDAIQALLLLRGGRRSCHELDRLLTRMRATELTPAVRKAIDAHASGCDICQGQRRRLLAPLVAFGAFAPVAAPAGLRERIAAAISERWGSIPPSGYRANEPAGHEHADPPVTARVDREVARRRPSGTALVAGGAALAGLVALIAVVLLPGGEDTPTLASAEATTPAIAPAAPGASSTVGGPGPGGTIDSLQPAGGSATPSPSAPVLSGGTATPTPGPSAAPPTASVTPVASLPAAPATQPGFVPPGPSTATAAPPTAAPPAPVTPATATPTATATATATSTATATATPTVTPTPCPADIDASTTSLAVGQGTSRSLQVTNSGCTAASVTTQLAAGAPWLSVGPASFTLGPGETRTITATVDREALPEGTSTSGFRIVRDGAVSTSVSVSASLTGDPPQVSSASASCSPPDVTVTVNATDDRGIVSAYVTPYGSSARTPLSLASGTATAGTWKANVTGSFGVYVVTVVDRAGQTATANAVC